MLTQQHIYLHYDNVSYHIAMLSDLLGYHARFQGETLPENQLDILNTLLTSGFLYYTDWIFNLSHIHFALYWRRDLLPLRIDKHSFTRECAAQNIVLQYWRATDRVLGGRRRCCSDACVYRPDSCTPFCELCQASGDRSHPLRLRLWTFRNGEQLFIAKFRSILR
jgi:hypothetical protein